MREPDRKLIHEGTTKFGDKDVEVIHAMYEYKGFNVIERINIWYQKDLDVVIHKRYDYFHHKDSEDVEEEITEVQNVILGEVINWKPKTT